MNDLVRIPFHGTEILAVDIDGKPHVAAKPACESFGLAWSSQLQKLKSASWAGMTIIDIPTKGGVQQMSFIDQRTLLMWLATINVNKVKDEARPLLIAYQQEVADVLEAYWTQGFAVNPRANEDQLERLSRIGQAQLRVLQMANGLVDPKFIESKARIVVARSLGEVPEINPADMPLLVETYLKERAVNSAVIKDTRSVFGARLSKLYFARHGKKPLKATNEVNGSIRPINSYTEADRGLFDEIYEAMLHDLHPNGLQGELAA